MNKKYFGLIEVIIIVIVTGIVCGISTGLILINHDNFKNINYADLSKDQDVKEFLEVYASIITNYYENVNKDELINSAINGMMNYLGDDYTNYLDKESSKALAERLAGEYEGIGVQIIGENVIYEVFEDSPAMAAGIKKDDKIIKVNGTLVEGKKTSEVATMIKSSVGGKVELVILRDKEEIEINVELKRLNIPSIAYEIIKENNKNVGYMYIETFSNTTASQVKKALTKMESDGIDSLILDLRGNTGGYLASAKDIANIFLEKGKVIYSLEDKNKKIEVKSDTLEHKTYPVAVLINGGSASASEILAAALKESYGAILVGEKSYGKGKVQQTMDLDSGGMIKYTSAKWLTPNGVCIDKVGIKPDYEITPDYDLVPKNQDDENDWKKFEDYMKNINENQLKKAIEVITK